MTGVVVGGWEYVWTAYAITAGGLLIYAISLFSRLRNARGGSGASAANNV
jgi:hypothetical protein